ncbi:MAG: hypothetical protein WCH34_09975 [Bacteroidota bacterium]
MTKFILNLVTFISLALLVIILILSILNYSNFSKTHFQNMPINNVSNSTCLNAKIDHLIVADNCKNATFLIAGSSMSLNNISGGIIQNRTNNIVYNLSSWAFKPKSTDYLIQSMNLEKIKYLLVAFNNVDFKGDFYQGSKEGITIDFKSTKYFINENIGKRIISILTKFNAKTFTADWTYRCKFQTVNNAQESIKFDKYGSVMLEHTGFKINMDRWKEGYKDTIGFYNSFLHDVTILDSTCNKNKIRLILVYLPNRPLLLTKNDKSKNKMISKILESKFGKRYLDMQNIEIPTRQFCDGMHMFRDGAESITNSIIDSLVNKKLINIEKVISKKK